MWWPSVAENHKFESLDWPDASLETRAVEIFVSPGTLRPVIPGGRNVL
jgi:hypothetical protein